MVLCCVVVVHGTTIATTTTIALAHCVRRLLWLYCVHIKAQAHNVFETEHTKILSHLFEIQLLFFYLFAVSFQTIGVFSFHSFLYIFFHILFALNVFFVKKNVTQQLLSINERKKKKGCLKLFILKRTQSNAETFE